MPAWPLALGCRCKYSLQQRALGRHERLMVQYGRGAAKACRGKGPKQKVQVLGLLCAPASLWRETNHKVAKRGPGHSNDGRVGDTQEGDRETVGLHREEQLVSLAIEDGSRLELQAA